MSEIWYVTRKYMSTIERVEVQRHTESSVWINDNRSARSSEFSSYFKTWDEAKAYLLARAQRKLESARLGLQRAQGEYGNVVGMKAPTDA